MKSLRSTITTLLLRILRNWKSDLEREGGERKRERKRGREREREKERERECRSTVDVMKVSPIILVCKRTLHNSNALLVLFTFVKRTLTLKSIPGT